MEIPSLKQLRENAGIGFNQACRRLGIGSAHLLRWEKGQYEPTVRYVRPLASLYQVSTDTIIDAIEGQRERRHADAVSSDA
jgi:transcriptional regulator with XRE-family HTH domain